MVEEQLENRQASSTAGPVNSSRIKLDRNKSIDHLAQSHISNKHIIRKASTQLHVCQKVHEEQHGGGSPTKAKADIKIWGKKL